jgi:hypothetical protein
MDEEWFKELVSADQKQREIDLREQGAIPYSSNVDVYGKQSPLIFLAKRPVGRPSTDWRIVNKILAIYDESIAERKKSLRSIAREVNNVVDHCTVRNILNKYR